MSGTTGISDILLYLFMGLGVLFSLMVVLGRNPISCAFSLVLVFFNVAAVYALLEAHFLAGMQILVYAGAVMVLFVFVIMLLNADTKSTDFTKSRLFQGVSATLCFLLFAMFAMSFVGAKPTPISGPFTSEKITAHGGNFRVISELMFSDYILPFEMTSILLLVGIVGSVALAKRSKGKKSS